MSWASADGLFCRNDGYYSGSRADMIVMVICHKCLPPEAEHLTVRTGHKDRVHDIQMSVSPDGKEIKQFAVICKDL